MRIRATDRCVVPRWCSAGVRNLALTGVLVISIVVPSAHAAAGVEALDVEVVIDPGAGRIDSTATLAVTPSAGSEFIEVLLNRKLDVLEVGADVELAGFEHVREGDGPYQYAPQATPLRVRLATPATGRVVELRVTYRGEIEPDAWGVIQLHEKWVELVATSSGWVPITPSGPPFEVSWRARLPEGWAAVGTGSARGADGWWQASAADAEDLVVIAAPDLKRLSLGDSLSIAYGDLPPGAPDLIAADATRVRDTLSGWFGAPKGAGGVEIVFARRDSGGGYARPGLVVMLYDGAYAEGSAAGPGFIRFLAHEISHLWWTGACTTDWQDWLNESFAEMSALMILREWFGEEEFEDRLDRHRRASAGAPPVRGVDRSDEVASTVLYKKGPVLLAELEASIGREAFLSFLRARAEGEVNTTEDTLDLLSGMVSPDAREQLDSGLRRWSVRAFLSAALDQPSSSGCPFEPSLETCIGLGAAPEPERRDHPPLERDLRARGRPGATLLSSRLATV